MGVVQVDDVVPTVVVNKVDNRLVVLWPHTRGVIHQSRGWIRYLRESGERLCEREERGGEGVGGLESDRSLKDLKDFEGVGGKRIGRW